MARIPKDQIERMKEEIDLAAWVRQDGVELKRVGRNLRGLCPFHDDTEPSLVVTPEKNLWNCLGACGSGGDVFQWVMKKERVSFRHAFEIVKERYVGVATGNDAAKSKTPLESPVEATAEDSQLLLQVVEYYHRRLQESPAALAYLKKRGIDSAEAIERFNIGFSDRSLGLRLPPKAQKAGREMRERLERLGIYRESGHEHFTGSVVFPVFSSDGEVTQIYGRKIGSHLKKGTPLHLYLSGPHRGVWNMEAENPGEDIILCESIIDALTFWCAGYRNVTASYGINGFIDDHLTAFERCGKKRILIAYDRDKAGDEATTELVNERLLPAGFDCYRVQFPRDMDANQYALKVTPAEQSLGIALRQAVWLGENRTAAANDLAAAAKEENGEPAADSNVPSPCPAQQEQQEQQTQHREQSEQQHKQPSSPPEPVEHADEATFFFFRLLTIRVVRPATWTLRAEGTKR